MDNAWKRTSDTGSYPRLYSFITFRPERFGGLLFNPYLGLEEELDTVEAYIVSLCDGYNTCQDVSNRTGTRFGFTPSRVDAVIAGVVRKLDGLWALTYGEKKEGSSPGLPLLPVFTDDVPALSAPKSVIWDVTYACNLRCGHCLTSSGKAWENELDTGEAIRLVHELEAAGILNLSLSGGEPLLRPDILTLLREMAGTKIRVDIATNGVDVPSALVRQMGDLPVFQIQVSIDGIGETHDIFRGVRGAFESSCRTIRALREEGIAVSISTTVTAQNVSELDQIIGKALELGCSGFKAIPFLAAGRGRRNEELYALTPGQHRAMCVTLEKHRRELQGQMNISSESSFAFLLQRSTMPPRSYGSGPMGCSAGYDTLSIGSDGTAYPCPFLHDFRLGNLTEMTLKEIWNQSTTLRRLRSIVKEDFDEPCKSCDYAPSFCRGGCRAAAYLEHGSIHACDPNCFRDVIETGA